MDYLLRDVMDYITQNRGSRLRAILFIICMCAVSLPLHAAPSAAESYQSANAASIELYRDVDKKKDRVSWMAVIHKYQNVGKNYPRTSYAPRAWFKVGRLYEDLNRFSSNPKDLDRAVDAYMTVADSYPSSSLADDAVYRSARIYHEGLSSPQQAYTLYQKVIRDFPKGDMVQLAREQMNSLNIEKKTVTGIAKKDLGDVKTLRQWSDRDYTRVVVDLDENITFKTFTLPADAKAGRPDRVVIELDNAKITPELPDRTKVNDGILTNIRVSQYQSTKVRIVLDLAQKISYHAFPLADPNRLVVDIIKDGASPKIAHEPSGANTGGVVRTDNGNGFKKVPKWSPSQMGEDVPSIAAQLSLKVSKIVIDPGHGGKDPGALGPAGVMEKDLTLAIGKALARRLRLEGFDVYLTRDSDVFLTLEERTAFANKKRADLFVSIHINAHNNRTLQGIETYFLNLTTDSSAIEVAARENATTSKSISDLQLIINDLMLNSKINESSRFASSVHKCVMSSVLNNGYQGKDLGVKQAPFYVLLGAQMPSILCELGFITNGADSSLLQCDSHQSTLIDGIAKGINKYIMNTTYAYLRRK
ncbi:MAG TPA: N-acetylmuramoyl-L-alanine amidase [Deltaproteobacteria bacterium]|nr:N-acetylmuramoyl-L-alanine amidase [Deltaproteobacteria bacterium]HXK48761.1 N-acetylmuramoyl-L-alanine amidase [Deltaproteobacteria bacterium]